MCSASPKASDNDAWALLSLRSAPASPTRLSSCWSPDEPKGVALARLEGRDFEYTMRLPQRRLTVGRSSSKGEVDINMEHSSFVSRNHLQIHYSTDNNGASRFFLTCSGKNGIFVDGIFQRKGAEALELPRSCTLRFPSTTLKISFQALIDSEIPPPPPPPVALPPKYAKPMQPLHINIPPAPRSDAPSLISPCPSPTGTISAANSCPTSPRSSSSSVRSMLALDLPSAAAAAFARKQSSSDEMKEPLPCGIITGAEEEVAGSGSEKSKPPYSYAQLIVQAITSHPDRQLTLSGIYAYISKNYPYYRASDKGWQVAFHECETALNTLHARYELTRMSFDGLRRDVRDNSYLSIHQFHSDYRHIQRAGNPFCRVSVTTMNSIRHNLSLNRFFVKVPRSQEEPGKGSFWRVDSGSEGKLMEQAFRRRRQRVSCFRSPAGGDLSSRSAPVSPSHYDGSFTPEGNPHSAGLVPDTHSVTEANSDIKQESKAQSLSTSSASQRLLQLTNDLRFIQSAPVSPQGGPVQLMTMPNSVSVPTSIAVSRTSTAGVAFHPLSTLTAKQGVYLLQQTTLGGATVPTPMALANATSASATNAIKEADKSSVMLLKSIGNGNMLPTDMITQQQQQQSQRQDAAVTSASTCSSSSSNSSSSSLFGQLPITFIQPGSSTHSNDLIQKLLQQGAMVVGRMPEDSQSPSAVYSLPSSMMQSSLQPFHLVLGTQLMKQPDPSGATDQSKAVQPQIVVLPGGQGIKIEKLSPSKATVGSSHIGTQPGQQNSLSGGSVKTEESLSASAAAAASDGRKSGQNIWTEAYTKFKGESVTSSELQSSETKPVGKVEDTEENQNKTNTLSTGLSCSAAALLSINSEGSVIHTSTDQHPLVGSSSSSAAKDSVVASQHADYEVKAEKRPMDTASLLLQAAADRDCKRFKVDSDQ